MRLTLAISLFLILFSASSLRAQEAPGEDAPGMRTTRDAPSRELTPQERDQLNNLFKGEAPNDKTPAKYVPSVPAPGDAVAPPAPEPAQQQQPLIEPAITPLKGSSLYMDNTRILKFRMLNKQTTRLHNLELNEGGSLVQGTLKIALVECWHSPPDAREDSAALLEITDAKDNKGKPLYLGWMFANSPSLNPFEHPVYDISILECR